MPGSRVVVSNTSPLFNLALIERLDLLEAQFGTVTVPEQVWTELVAGEDGGRRSGRYGPGDSSMCSRSTTTTCS